jgi:hypothetical protein
LEKTQTDSDSTIRPDTDSETFSALLDKKPELTSSTHTIINQFNNVSIITVSRTTNVDKFGKYDTLDN